MESDHERVERRSLALHQAIADKIRDDPALLAIARDNLRRWKEHQGRSLRYLQEWERLLSAPLPALLENLLLDTPHMRALRQSSPFCGILTPRERWKIYEAF